MTQRLRPDLRAVAAIAAGLLVTVVFALLSPIGAATGASSPPSSPPFSPPSSPPVVFDVEIKNKPQLLARGAAVKVKLRVECPHDADNEWVNVRITQRVGNRIAYGAEARSFQCTGERQTVTVVVPAAGDSRPFRPRNAVISAEISAFIPALGSFEQAEDVEVRKLRR